MESSAHKPAIVLGAGGHCRTIISILQDHKYEITGILDTCKMEGEEVLSVPIIAEQTSFSRYLKTHDFFIAVGDNLKRRGLYQAITYKGGVCPPLVHSNATIHNSVFLGKGTIVASGAMLCPSVSVAENCIINSRALLEHDVNVGSHSHLAPDVSVAGNVTISEGAFVGMRSVIRDNISVGSWVKTGAGSVVVDHIPSGAIVAGNPARILSIEPFSSEEEIVDPIIEEGASLRQAMEVIDFCGVGYGIVVCSNGICKGIVTDGAIRREILAGTRLDKNVSDIINRDFFFLEEEREHEAINYFSRLINFIPILSSTGKLVKIINAKNFLTRPSDEVNEVSRKLKYLYRYLNAEKQDLYKYDYILNQLKLFSVAPILHIASSVEDLMRAILFEYKKEGGKSMLYVSYGASPLWVEIAKSIGFEYKIIFEKVSQIDGILVCHYMDRDVQLSNMSQGWVVEELHGFPDIPSGLSPIARYQLVFMDHNDEIDGEGAAALVTTTQSPQLSNVPTKIHPLQIACISPQLEKLPKIRRVQELFLSFLVKECDGAVWYKGYSQGFFGRCLPGKEKDVEAVLIANELDYEITIQNGTKIFQLNQLQKNANMGVF